MKDICVVICSYNGIKYLPHCLESLFSQSIHNFDICVVDNGSTDGTYDYLNKNYAKRVHILRNEENLGGSGGFETGIQYALSKDYEYIALLDNDIRLADDTFERLYKKIKENSDIGAVGSRVMYMDEPEKTMWYGLKINYEKYYSGERIEFDGDLPEEVECDFIPACTAIIPRHVLEECGTMPVDNFIYHDDADLCMRIKNKGYRILMLRDALTWHKGGSSLRTNTFNQYYGIRNEWQFFSKYLEDEKIESFADYVLDKTFKILFGSFHKGKNTSLKLYTYVFNDFINGIRGKAGEGRIFEIEGYHNDQIISIVKKAQKVGITGPSGDEGYEKAVRLLKKAVDECNAEIDFVENPHDETENADYYFVYCEHVSKVKESILPKIYFDQWLNIIANEDDYYYFKGFDTSKARFFAMYKPLLLSQIKSIRNEKK